MSQHFGEKVRNLRKDQGLTLQQLADQFGISKAYLWQIETRKNPNPSASLVLSAAKYFGVSPYFLIGETCEHWVAQEVDESILSKYASLSKDDKLVVDRMVDTLYDSSLRQRMH
jgi:transcriptional regulator with XRE-family HTH domain